MSYELTKAEKKIARRCLDKGLDAEYREGMEKFESIIRHWRAGKFVGNREAYLKLYDAVTMKDKAISRRYDGLSGSRWLVTIAGLLQDGYISKEDIDDFSDGTKALINRMLRA